VDVGSAVALGMEYNEAKMTARHKEAWSSEDGGGSELGPAVHGGRSHAWREQAP
jgi:hypothetical protein